MAINITVREASPLKISCDRSDCEGDLHCFRRSRRKSRHPLGACQECGATIVDWARVKARHSSDIPFVIRELKKEWVRHHFMNEPLDQYAINYALRKGRIELANSAALRIQASLKVGNPRDGRQTPWTGNPLYYAQHSTATCCRKCLEYWHGIPRGRELQPIDVQYFAALCMAVLSEKLPDLPFYGQKVPVIRRKSA